MWHKRRHAHQSAWSLQRIRTRKVSCVLLGNEATRQLVSPGRSGTHEMNLRLLLLMLMLLLPFILFLLWFFFFGIVPQQLRVGCLPKVVSCCYINPSMTQVSLDETICHLPPSSEPSCTCSQQHMLQIAKYQQQRTIAAQRSWNHNPEGIFCSFTPLIRSQPSFLFQGVLVPSFQ